MRAKGVKRGLTPMKKMQAQAKSLTRKGGTTLKKRLVVLGVVAIFVMALFALSAVASEAQLYFSSDSNGQSRVTNIQEGDEVWIVVIDNDKNIDCDVRDKFWADVKIMDPKTGAYIIWDSGGYKGVNVHDNDKNALNYDYFEETGADTGVFVSIRQFQIGTREKYATGNHTLGKYVYFTHVVDDDAKDFQWGDFIYDSPPANNNAAGDDRGYFQYDGSKWVFKDFATNVLTCMKQSPTALPHCDELDEGSYLIGRFENMDTLVGMYQDPKDDKDIAVGMMKIIDTEATISWDQEIYKDENGAAKVIIVDPDENLNCNKVEYVPFFVLVNPGSWNQTASATVNSFCALKWKGGLDKTGAAKDQIRWFNIYEDRYIWYPSQSDSATLYKTLFDVKDNVTKVVFFAKETGVSTGVFEYNFNSIRADLGFNSLNVHDVLVAYYLDPNDFDDFKLATAYIEEHQHSITSFTDSARTDKEVYWIGRDPVYVQVIDANANVDPCCPEQVVVHICDPHGEDDAEWIVLDETSSNSPVFFSNAGMRLLPVWDALGVGLAGMNGGYQLRLDNWQLEVFNEDDVYARYNDVYYTQASMNGLGDQSMATAFPPQIRQVRVFNDVSFDTMSIADTQVYNGSSTQMYFLDRQGNRVSGYVNSDCVFIEVIDPDQDEDQYRRERIDGFWDGGQNVPFGPVATEEFKCGNEPYDEHRCVNDLLGRVNIFNDNPATSLPHYYDAQHQVAHAGWAKVYVLNPRSGHWAAVDLLETGVATGDFVSVICIDLTSVYSECTPTLDVLPGDTIIAVYQDPSNHSDSAWISIKVGIGGGATPPSQQSTTMFVDAEGNEVTSYTDADLVYVKVIDPSHAGAVLLANAVEIGGVSYDLTPLAGATDEFITDGLDLGLAAGDTITATYTDPTDPTDTSSDTITIIASALDVERFYAGPSPFSDTTTFGYIGSGIASDMSVEVRDASGHVVWSQELANVTEIVWDGTDETGALLANGPYMYMITATDGTNTFTGDGWVFIDR